MRELVLTFHGVGEPGASTLQEERRYWMPTAEFKSFIAEAGAISRTKGVSLFVTFDDGNKSDIDIAAEVLASHKINGMFFPCAGRMGQKNYLSAEDVRTLYASGFGIGSHGMNHVKWSSLTLTELRDEVCKSRMILSETLGDEIKDAALPFGAYNRATLTELRRAGYRTIYSSDPGISQRGDFFRPRCSYRCDQPFEIADLVARFSRLSHRITAGIKYRIKSNR